MIGPGVYYSDGQSIPVVADDVSRWIRDFNEMKSLGLRVPVPIEHPEKSDPEGYPVDAKNSALIAERERAKFHGGWAEDVFVKDGVLQVQVDLKSDAAIEQAEKVGTYISPQFGPWTAPNGKKFENCITHFALTPRPANVNQSDKFTPVMALSQCGQTLRFSMADLQTQLNNGPPQQQQTPAPVPQPAAQPQQPAPGQQSDPLGQMKQALAALGITISDTSPIGKDPEALASLLSCVTQAHGQQAAKGGDDPSNPTGGGKPAGDVREEPRTVMMSQGTNPATPATPAASANPASSTAPANAPTSPAASPAGVDQTVQLSQANSRISALEAELTSEKRSKYKDRISAAFDAGKCTAPKRDALLQLAGTFQFSAAAPQSKGELDFRLEEIEMNPEGAVWSPEDKIKQLSVRETRPNPNFFDGEDLSDEDAEKLVNKMHPLTAPSGAINVNTPVA